LAVPLTLDPVTVTRKKRTTDRQFLQSIFLPQVKSGDGFGCCWVTFLVLFLLPGCSLSWPGFASAEQKGSEVYPSAIHILQFYLGGKQLALNLLPDKLFSLAIVCLLASTSGSMLRPHDDFFIMRETSCF
jgi:hypothetical protein